MADDFDAYYTWLGIPPSQQPPDHYRLLGIQPLEDNPTVIEHAADRQMAHLRTFQTGRHGDFSQRLLNEVASAKLCLLNPVKKAAYDAALRQKALEQAAAPPLIRRETAETASRSSGRLSPVVLGSIGVGAVVLIGLIVLALVLSPGGDKSPVASSDPKVKQPEAKPTAPPRSPAEVAAPGPRVVPPRPAAAPPPVVSPVRPFSPPPNSPGPVPSQPAGNPPVRPTPIPPRPTAPFAQPPPVAETPPGPAVETPAAPTASGRLPVPGKAACEPILRRVEEEHQLKAERPREAAVELVAKLIEAARAENVSPEERYVLLTSAEEVARSVGEAPLALEALTALGRVFEVDAPALKEQALGKLAASAATPEATESLIRVVDDAIDEATAAERFDLALRMAEHARVAAERSGSEAFRKRAAHCRSTAQKLAQRHAQVQQAVALLKSNPDHPAANGLLGQWFCFEKDDWAKGLPHLAKSDDERVRSAAQLELNSPPTDWKDQVALADRWWALADSARGRTRERLQSHAVDWYRKTVAASAGSPQHDRVARRLRGFAAKASGELVSLKKLGTNASPLECRRSQHRATLLARYGGTPESEKAVEAAQQWIVSLQFPDGGWSFAHHTHPARAGKGLNPGHEAKARNAATGLALMTLLGSGNTHRSGKYQRNVKAGLQFLGRQIKIDPNGGSLRDQQGDMYSHGVATIALCEAYAMTHDPALGLAVGQAVRFTCYAQDQTRGGWRHDPRAGSDTPNTGWQLAALHTAHLAGVVVPPEVTLGASGYLDSVQFDNGSRYGHESPGAGTSADTAAGLFCRMQLGWKRDHPALIEGASWLQQVGVSETDVYGNFQTTQLLFSLGGDAWDEWNADVREALIRSQATAGLERGSWFAAGGNQPNRGGRLLHTALNTLILETYYRYDPLDAN